MTQAAGKACHLCGSANLSEHRFRIRTGRPDRYGSGALEQTHCEVCGSVVDKAGADAPVHRIEMRFRDFTHGET